MEEPELSSSGMSSYGGTCYTLDEKLSRSQGREFSDLEYPHIGFKMTGNGTCAGISVRGRLGETGTISVLDSAGSISILTSFDWESTRSLVQKAKSRQGNEPCKRLFENTSALLEAKVANEKARGEEEIEHRLMVILGLREGDPKLSEAEEERFKTSSKGTVKLYTTLSRDIWLTQTETSKQEDFARAMIAVGHERVTQQVRKSVIAALLRPKSADLDEQEQEAEKEPAEDDQD